MRARSWLLVLALGCEPSFPSGEPLLDGGLGEPERDAGRLPTGQALVGRVIDGDTIVLSAGSGARAPDGRPLDGERVRLIGVDTPELATESRPAECFALEAKAFAEEQVGGRVVELEYDFGTGLRDPFGRLLAYVATSESVLNERLVVDGYAEVFRRFEFRERSRYLELEAEARRQRVGRWGACGR